MKRFVKKELIQLKNLTFVLFNLFLFFLKIMPIESQKL